MDNLVIHDENLNFHNFVGFVFSTTKRPVPLEHCLFYSGELYKVCENEVFISKGIKDAKDAHKKKNSSAVSVGPKQYTGSSAHQDGNKSQKHEAHSRGKQNKHSGVKDLGKSSYGGNGQNNGAFRRSAASNWLLLIKKLSKKSLLPVCYVSLVFPMVMTCIFNPIWSPF